MVKADHSNAAQSDPSLGLSSREAIDRLQRYGRNKIDSEEKRPWWRILVAQLVTPIVYLLLFAAAMSLYFNEYLDAAAILMVIVANTAIGFYMEYQANRSMEALQNLTRVNSKVYRDSRLTQINSEEIVPGDMVYLEAGDMVPADGKIFQLSKLQVNESALTGESVPVDKSIKEVSAESHMADPTNHLFKGTFVTNGNATFLVTATGMGTELGKIARMVQSAEQSATPLEKKLETFSKKLIRITLLLVIAIFVMGWSAGHNLMEMVNTAIALSVAAIPEGLPVVATLALARGMLKMAKHKVIVKKLSAVETLGGTSVICTDKTGTLTENKMTVKEVSAVQPSMTNLLTCASVLCNTASVDASGNEVGDPLEVALLNNAALSRIDANTLRGEQPKIDEEPFTSESKRMLTLHRKERIFVTYAKGAVESILEICQSDPTHTTEYLKQADHLASSGYKVIGFAYKEQETNSISDGLVFLGMMALIDPPRPDVANAILQSRDAGIKVVMITGDHPATAKEIGRQLGIDAASSVIVGADMKPYSSLNEADKVKWLTTNIFARVTPAQKLDLITLYQERGYIVGMTGDGVNDAPALKKADIGIAMGQRGTQVAQDVADMVIKDDSFTSIVTAIRQGRIIFDNIRKFVIFLLSCNLSELFTIAVTAVLNFPFQLFPLQILFINLITDVLPALALGVTPGAPQIMKHQPRKSSEPILNNSQWKAVIFYSLVISAASLGAVVTSEFLFYGAENWNPEVGNNILFFTLIGSQILHVFNMNTSASFFRSEIVRNRYVWYAISACVVIMIVLFQIPSVREALSVYPLEYFDWLTIVTFSCSGMIVNQLARKLKLIKQ